MDFQHGDRASELKVVGSVPKKQTGTTVRFWPDPKYFDSPKISLSKLKHVLRAKAVLCAGGVGGAIHGGFAKSKNSVISICAASRLVRLGRLKRASMSLRIAV